MKQLLVQTDVPAEALKPRVAGSDVVLEFPLAVVWLRLRPDQARALATQLWRRANEAEDAEEAERGREAVA